MTVLSSSLRGEDEKVYFGRRDILRFGCVCTDPSVKEGAHRNRLYLHVTSCAFFLCVFPPATSLVSVEAQLFRLWQ